MSSCTAAPAPRLSSVDPPTFTYPYSAGEDLLIDEAISHSQQITLKPAEYLDDSESLAAYMSDALESEDPAFVADALGVMARAHGMSEIAREAGVSRESLYRSLSTDGNPEFATVLRVIRALGLQLSATRIRGKIA